jgi:bifunctional oligoribonuclease and PAP phosphatase NrnA
MTIDWSPLLDIINSNQRFIISSHVRPDADAVGSGLGLASALKQLGKTVKVVNPSGMTPGITFLDPDHETSVIGEGTSFEEVLDTDVHIIVDTSAWKQLEKVGDALKQTSAIKVVIDHHVSSDDLGAIEFKDVTAAATGELIFEIIEALEVTVPAIAANALYCAIATDTGWFRFPATTRRTMRIAGELIDFGAEPHVLYQLLYERHSEARMHLFGRVLDGIRLSAEGRLAYLSVALKDFKDTGALSSDTEELVNECLRIEGVKASFIAIEQPNKTVKMSFRSRLGTNVAAVAEELQGGGHKQAAGATYHGTLPDALATVLPLMQNLVTPSTNLA